ncbi:MAG: DUF3240 family protein [Hyphomonadaceae bacterium]|nr:DUF3240 family protein [Hyphomonadaceae bacterium]
MVTDLCRLTLVYPPASEPPLVAALLAIDPPMPGFTTWRGAGHGTGFEHASHAERVTGQVRRSLLTSILPRSHADQVLERIRLDAPVPHLTYWIEPVLAAGRLT